MADQLLRIIYNTRERALSTDLNDTTNLIHRGLMQALKAVLGERSGVIEGFETTIVGVGLDVTVSPGIALLNTGGSTADDSDFTWIELDAADTVTLPAADGANPRWDVIEVEENDAVILSTPRDIFDPSTGTFTPQAVTKRRGSSPTLSVRSGTPAATPLLPAGIAGRIPLAYIRVPAAAVNLVTTDFVRCRPLVGSEDVRGEVQGGGISVAAPGLAVSVHEARGKFPGRAHSWRIPGGLAITLAANIMVNTALPVADDIIHFYAIPAPYPTGYDSHLAGREFVPGSTVLALFPCAAAGIEGAVVIASTSDPDAATLQGAPAAGGPITCGSFGTIAIDDDSAAFLGSTFFRFATTDLISQQYKGAGTVFHDLDDTGTVQESDSQSSTSQGLTSYDLTRSDPLSIAGSTVVPPHATESMCRITQNITGSVISNVLLLSSLRSGYTETLTANAGYSFKQLFKGWVDITGQWNHQESAGGTSAINVQGEGYRDGILARR
jgi:hypothetical protein